MGLICCCVPTLDEHLVSSIAFLNCPFNPAVVLVIGDISHLVSQHIQQCRVHVWAQLISMRCGWAHVCPRSRAGRGLIS